VRVALGSFDSWPVWLFQPSSAYVQLTPAFWTAGRSRHDESATGLAATDSTAVDVRFWLSPGSLACAARRGLASCRGSVLE